MLEVSLVSFSTEHEQAEILEPSTFCRVVDGILQSAAAQRALIALAPILRLVIDLPDWGAAGPSPSAWAFYHRPH